MTSPCVDIEGVDSRREHLQAYSGVQEAAACVLYPDTEDQLRKIFRYAGEHRCRLTFRAGGHSFDAQSLNNDIVVCMDRFDAIEVGDDTVTVGAGATWSRILRMLEAYGRVPAVMVTTGSATAGGTLSGNCLSRFSPAYGKEGTRVRSFRLMTPDGMIHDCRRPQAQAAALDDEERLFLATIGGLGYLGAVLSITYDVLEAPKGGPPTYVRTQVARVGDLARYVDHLVECVRDMHAQESTTQDESLRDAVYSAVCFGQDGGCRALVLQSTLTRYRPGRRLLVYEPRDRFRPAMEVLFRFRWCNELVWWLAYEIFHRRRKSYVNRLDDFAFFMDGNARAKRFASRFGIKLKTLQQTFVVPSDFSSPRAIQKTKHDLRMWLLAATEIFRKAGIMPTFQDVLWLPHDRPFLLSTTAHSGGFAVSYAFDCNTHDRVVCTGGAFDALSEAAAERGVRVYLVKNVYAQRETLAEMYGQNLDAFRALKAKVDPGGVLVNPFFTEKLA